MGEWCHGAVSFTQLECLDSQVEREQKEYGPDTNFWLKFRPYLGCHHTPRLGPELGGAKVGPGKKTEFEQKRSPWNPIHLKGLVALSMWPRQTVYKKHPTFITFLVGRGVGRRRPGATRMCGLLGIDRHQRSARPMALAMPCHK